MPRVSVQWYGAAVRAIAAKAVDAGLQDAADHLLGASQDLVPIEEATLERSGRAEVRKGRGIVSYDTPYAVRQHEDLHLAHDPGRQAKYLEQPATTEQDTLVKLMAGPVDRALR